MGWLSSLTGGGQVGAAKQLTANSFYTPYNLALPGANINYQNTGPLSSKDWRAIKNGRMPMPTQGASATLSPEMQQMRTLLGDSAFNSIMQSQSGVPGYAGVTQPLFNEFGLANYSTDQLGTPWKDIGNIGQYYAPELPDTAMQGFLGASNDFTNRAQSMPQFDIATETQNQLDLMRQADAPYEQRGMMANWDNQFGKGVLSSTPGQYQSQALMDSYQQKDIQRQLAARQAALGQGQFQLGQQNQYAQQGLGFGPAAGDLGTMLFGNQLAGQGFLSGLDAQRAGINAQQFGVDMASNQLAGSRVQDRFGRAMDMFGLGQQSSAQQANTGLGFLSGQGGIDAYLANLMGLGGNLGSQRSAANVNAYSPLVQARAAQDNAIQGWTSGALGAGMGYLGGGWDSALGGFTQGMGYGG